MRKWTFLLLLGWLTFIPAPAGAHSAPELACAWRITEAAAQLPGGVKYQESSTPGWVFSGVVGETQTIQHFGGQFTVVKVYYHWPGMPVNYTWVTVDKTLARRLHPGSHRVSVGLSGSFVTPEGIDCARCAVEDCRLFCIVEDADLGVSQTFIHTGWAPRHPMYGFLMWAVSPEQPLDLCNIPAPTPSSHAYWEAR